MMAAWAAWAPAAADWEAAAADWEAAAGLARAMEVGGCIRRRHSAGATYGQTQTLAGAGGWKGLSQGAFPERATAGPLMGGAGGAW